MLGLLSHITAITVTKGVGFNSLTYPSTHNPPVHQNHPVNKHLHPCIHHDFHKPALSAPVTSGQIVSALSMPSAKQLLAAFELFLQSLLGNGVTIHSMVRPTSCHSPPTHLPPYATKEVPPASSKKVTALCGVALMLCMTEFTLVVSQRLQTGQ